MEISEVSPSVNQEARNLESRFLKRALEAYVERELYTPKRSQYDSENLTLLSDRCRVVGH